MSTLKTTTTETFREDATAGVVLVKFESKTCGPCRAMAPLLDKIAKEYEGRVKFLIADIAENEFFAERYKVRVVPTLVFLRDGHSEGELVGSASEHRIKDFIEELI